jgi:hypothetical protein
LADGSIHKNSRAALNLAIPYHLAVGIAWSLGPLLALAAGAPQGQSLRTIVAESYQVPCEIKHVSAFTTQPFGPGEKDVKDNPDYTLILKHRPKALPDIQSLLKAIELCKVSQEKSQQSVHWFITLEGDAYPGEIITLAFDKWGRNGLLGEQAVIVSEELRVWIKEYLTQAFGLIDREGYREPILEN